MNKWTLCVIALLGQPWPAPPPLPGRLCHPLGAWPTDYDDDDLRALGPADVAHILNVTRQAGANRIARCKATNDFSNLLAPPVNPRRCRIEAAALRLEHDHE